MAQLWQIDIVTDAMPCFISSRHWHTEQEQSALADLYARPNLGSNLYQAAILELIKAAEAQPAKLLRLVPNPQIGHLSSLLASLTLTGAVEYLKSAQLPLMSFCAASSLLRHLDKMAATCAHPDKGCAGQLELVNALHSEAVEDTPTLHCKPVTYFPWPAPGTAGITCSSLDRCIKDLLHHYLCEAIEVRHAGAARGHLAVTSLDLVSTIQAKAVGWQNCLMSSHEETLSLPQITYTNLLLQRTSDTCHIICSAA